MSFPLRPKTDTIQSNTASECESMIFARFAMGGSRRSSFTWCATVDKIEDTKSREFSKVQQRSTSRPYLLEIENTENRDFARGRNPPWYRCATFGRIFRFNSLQD